MTDHPEGLWDDLSKRLLRPADGAEMNARAVVTEFFAERKDEVFFSRQIEVLHEDDFFHWVTNRAIRDLVSRG